jgi:transcriptional regulator with XRE-family HTH domain
MRIEEAFGRVLRKNRVRLDLTQEKLAFISGLDRTAIGLLERGERKALIDTIFMIAEGLKMKPSQLIQETEIEMDSE